MQVIFLKACQFVLFCTSVWTDWGWYQLSLSLSLSPMTMKRAQDFYFKSRRIPVDWKSLSLVQVEEIESKVSDCCVCVCVCVCVRYNHNSLSKPLTSQTDVKSLQKLIENIAFCNYENPDEFLLKIFKLAQFIIGKGLMLFY